ncbi:hypothetical protein J0910_12985 [Nocardiopsis sp. CNT-189]|uniref:hypothetical protein n=1 Tax=Nocardiopsis oceanisediminis TaxID=2816862 RepID=UPI003B32BBC4
MNHPALAGLDAVDWASLGHAYGTAEDLPALLAAAGSADPEEAEEAVYELFGTVWHQGTLYSATAPAVPFLVALGADPRTRDRGGLIALVGEIAEAADRHPEVRTEVRAALTAELPRLIALLADPEEEVRRSAAFALGHLRPDEPGPAAAALRDRLRDLSGAPEPGAAAETAGLVAALGLVDPERTGWVGAWLGPDRPARVRAAAAWVVARSPCPWTEAAERAVLQVWGGRGERPAAGAEPGDPFPAEEWRWTEDCLSDVLTALDGTPDGARLLDALLGGGPEAAVNALSAVHDLCTGSRASRERLAPAAAAAVTHPDAEVRESAVLITAALPGATRAAADDLAALTAGAPPPGRPGAPFPYGEAFLEGEPRTHWAAVLALLRVGDPRWRPPVARGLRLGPVPVLDSVLAARPCFDEELLDAARAGLRLMLDRSAPTAGTEYEVPGMVEVVRLLASWDERCSPALDDLLRAAGHTGYRVVEALAGPAVRSAAVAERIAPALAARAADAAVPMAVRMRFAIALAAATGEHGPAEALAAGADPQDALRVAGFAAEYGVAREPIAARLRALLSTGGPAGRAAPGALGAAGELHRLTGETAAPLAVLRRELDGNPLFQEAIALAGRIGPAAAEVAPVLRSVPVYDFNRIPLGLALHRVTGEPEPLLEAVRTELGHGRCGPELPEAVRSLGAAARPLLPRMRELRDGDGPCGPLQSRLGGLRAEVENRDRLTALVAEAERYGAERR